tara:strand:- start:176 stop:394 length:219 start_codon:yes stop_codon:yes gene_type:complete
VKFQAASKLPAPITTVDEISNTTPRHTMRRGTGGEGQVANRLTGCQPQAKQPDITPGKTAIQLVQWTHRGLS